MSWGNATTRPFHYRWVQAFISAMPWKRLLACMTGSVDQELLVRNAYRVTENKDTVSGARGRVRCRERLGGLLEFYHGQVG